MEEIKVPIYLITGFLESGKTSFLSFTLQQDYFQVEGKTLLILCEEGEEEYDEEALKKSNTVVEVIDSEEELTPERLAAMDILHQPERVIIEYGGLRHLVCRFHGSSGPLRRKNCPFQGTCPETAWNGKQILCSRKNSHDMLCR